MGQIIPSWHEGIGFASHPCHQLRRFTVHDVAPSIYSIKGTRPKLERHRGRLLALFHGDAVRVNIAQQEHTLAKGAQSIRSTVGHVGTNVAARQVVSSRETQNRSRAPYPFPFLGEMPLTFARNALSQVVHAFAGSTIKGTRSGIFASTRAFSCEAEVLGEVRAAI